MLVGSKQVPNKNERRGYFSYKVARDQALIAFFPFLHGRIKMSLGSDPTNSRANDSWAHHLRSSGTMSRSTLYDRWFDDGWVFEILSALLGIGAHHRALHCAACIRWAASTVIRLCPWYKHHTQHCCFSFAEHRYPSLAALGFRGSRATEVDMVYGTR